MGDKRKKSGKDGLEPEDFRLWKAFTHDIEPLSAPDWAKAEETPSPPAGKKISSESLDLSARSASSAPAQPPQLDARTETRLRRGQMPIEGRLDLHGYNQEQAHRMLNDFLLAAHKRGKRCLLVITGKGRLAGEAEYAAVTGVLKQKLPLWLSMTPLREIVLKTLPAVQRDGGGGAWYVYLKRQRDYTP